MRARDAPKNRQCQGVQTRVWVDRVAKVLLHLGSTARLRATRCSRSISNLFEHPPQTPSSSHRWRTLYRTRRRFTPSRGLHYPAGALRWAEVVLVELPCRCWNEVKTCRVGMFVPLPPRSFAWPKEFGSAPCAAVRTRRSGHASARIGRAPDTSCSSAYP